MSFNNADRFDKNRFKHACEILGYTILQTFSQNFVLLIGSGQNGKTHCSMVAYWTNIA